MDYDQALLDNMTNEQLQKEWEDIFNSKSCDDVNWSFKVLHELMNRGLPTIPASHEQ